MSPEAVTVPPINVSPGNFIWLSSYFRASALLLIKIPPYILPLALILPEAVTLVLVLSNGFPKLIVEPDTNTSALCLPKV